MPGLTRQACWLALLMCLTFGSVYAQDCDIVYDSSLPGTPNQGTFESPGWPQNYPTSRQCTYKFIGNENQRVQIKITKFNLQGVSPQCKFDYLDIYVQINNRSVSIMQSTLLGRFCGDGIEQLPKLIRSTGNIIALYFFSDSQKSDQGFYGTYEFIDAWTKIPGPSNCNYKIEGFRRKTGYIVSPTYPAIYPDKLNCTYRLVGIPQERIKLTFVDFSLFHGEDYCPFDFLEVYDGSSEGSPLIKKFCGIYKNNTVIYSSKKDLYIKFNTASGRIDFETDSLYDNVDFTSDRRGFNITYEFSDSLVFIDNNKPNMQHVPGTLCDVRITSRGESNGTIDSPYYPATVPAGITCNYYIDGLSNPDSLEKVEVTFVDFEIPGDKPNCDRGYLAVNLRGTKTLAGIADEKFCGTLLPPTLTSEEPRMILTLDTNGLLWGRGFSIFYQFVKDFGIPGQQVERGKCKFLYDSAKHMKGGFNSPLHHSGGIDCTYIFRPKHGSEEKLLISFLSFSMGPYKHDPECSNSDYLQIYEEVHTRKQDYIPIKRYCSRTFPGPIFGHRGMKFTYHANRNSRNSSFQALYEFIPKHDRKLKTYCDEMIYSDGTGGLITSPGYPEKYKSYSVCNWTIKASKRTNQILVQFYLFHTEGKLDATGMGCQNAVMRLYRSNNFAPEELCGSLTNQAYLSTNDTFRLEFLTSSAALGAKGFKITWTEINGDKVTEPCYGFRCTKSNYCISAKLRCNKLPNCGKSDDSDEKCGINHVRSNLAIVIMLSCLIYLL
ncbi:hypothetical protein KUTeg_006653 [Tegillarca granosa]|uniref:CUB domain-containing protein n=1 Tax=Tegillarca granosa TaxID=220873 RepID=A0ABQ9FFQ6_TEGGR|nr:hypothetical protein KUTeg_006653 [Tegillarca granosa]